MNLILIGHRADKYGRGRGYNLRMTAEQNLPEPIWVDTTAKLKEVVAQIADQPALAVDTESNSLFAYREQVCLIQISIPAQDFLIDPLAIRDLSPLAPIFADPEKEKIFHASDYDILCLKRDFHFEFNHLFDTMIAARILSEPQVGLAPLLESKLGIVIDKKHQRANWGIRPLSISMRDYARLDSHYLFALRDLFAEKLKARNLWELAQEDFRLACTVEIHNQNEEKRPSCWKVAGSKQIDERQAAILQQLCDYREEQARRMNLPLFKVLSNDLLVAVCLANPQSLDELKELRGVTERMLQRHGQAMIEAVKRGNEGKPLFREPRQRPDEQYLKRVDMLKCWRKELGRRLGVESDVVLPREILEQIAAVNPRSTEELKNVMKAVPWRYSHFGRQIRNVLRTQEVA